MKLSEAVSKRIEKLAKERNITVNKLCTIAGIIPSTINKISTLPNHDPRLSTIAKLCEGLGITLDEFFNDKVFNQLDPFE